MLTAIRPNQATGSSGRQVIGHPLTRALRRIFVILPVASLVMSGGCATMHHNGTQHVIVASEPPGARIYANGEPVGVTPDFVTLNRHGAVLRLEKDGFMTEEIRVSRLPSAWFGGSALLAGPFLWSGPMAAVTALTAIVGTDLGTGAAWKFRERIETTLAPQSGAAAPVSRVNEMNSARGVDDDPERR